MLLKDSRASVSFGDEKFRVPVAAWFFSVAVQQISPAQNEVPSQMFDDECDGIDVRRRALEKLTVVKLAMARSAKFLWRLYSCNRSLSRSSIRRP